MNKCCEFELMITGIRPGCVSHNLQCQIEHSAEPVVLHIEAAFKVRASLVLQGQAVGSLKLFAS